MAMRFRDHQDAAHTATRRLLLLFVGVLLLLVLAVNGVLALIYKLSFPWTGGFPRLFFETNTALVLLFVLGGCWFEMLRLREGGAHVARLAGGRGISEPHGKPHDLYEKRLVNVVDEVAIACNVKSPQVFVLPREDAINAFAAGWQLEDSVIAVTRGAMEKLTRDELQGVVAHEFSHLVHGDTRLNMRLIGLVWGLQMIYNFGHSLVEPDEDGHRHPAFLFGLGLMAVGSLGWIAGRLLKAAVSRQREFLADASAVKFTRSMTGIGGALRKIADQAWRRQDTWHNAHAESLSHLFFVSSLRWARFATHPPLAERIQRIYGHAVGPLPARALPPEDDDSPDTEPMEGGFGGAMGFASGVPGGPSAALTPESEALRHDALQKPEFEGPAAREREAIARIRRWQGPGERKAAVLALLMAPDNARELKAWQVETDGIVVAQAVRADVADLTHAARLPVLELLWKRTARAPMPERRSMVESARRVMGADGHASPLDRLRWLAMRHVLSGSAPAQAPPTGHNDIAHLSQEVAALTAFLARIVDAEAAQAGEAEPVWYRAVMRALLSDQPMPPWRVPDADALVAAMQGVAALSSMQRPVLLRTWVDAAVQLSPAGRLGEAASDALRLMALLLDTPSPKQLADQYIEVGDP
jgi:Zn-dependent protease with chaperone function